jgi:hypothetical protein
MAVETQEAWCQEHVNFKVGLPKDGIVEISTKDPRLKSQHLYLLQSLSDRQDIATQTINSCNACKGNILECILKRGGS